MNWQTILSEIQASGMTQMQIAAQLDKSQAWVSAVAQGKFKDLRWGDGEALMRLHRSRCDSEPDQEAA